MTNIDRETEKERERDGSVCVVFGLSYGIHLFVEMLKIQVMDSTIHSQAQQNKANCCL